MADRINDHWIKRGLPALVLAPMEGITDAPMRALLSERGGFSFCVSEFLRVSQEVPPARILLEHVPELRTGCRTAAGLPVQVQLLGGDPGRLALTAALACEAGALAIDLNFGCPAPTVNRHDGGAALLRHPERIRAIVAAVRAAVPPLIPVSAKLRLGWDTADPIELNAEMAAAGGASWITIHGRTKTQGYAPPAYWKPIGAVRERLGIPVVANGEIWTLADFRRCAEETGCEHFMIGRGALADPALPLAIASELGLPGSPLPPLGTAAPAWLPLLERFAELAIGSSMKPGYVPSRIKQWVKLARSRRQVEWFEGIKTASTVDEMLGKLRALADPSGQGGAQADEEARDGRDRESFHGEALLQENTFRV